MESSWKDVVCITQAFHCFRIPRRRFAGCVYIRNQHDANLPRSIPSSKRPAFLLRRLTSSLGLSGKHTGSPSADHQQRDTKEKGKTVVHFGQFVCLALEPVLASNDSESEESSGSHSEHEHSSSSSSSSTLSSHSESHQGNLSSRANAIPTLNLDLGLDLRLSYPGSPTSSLSGSIPPTRAQSKPLPLRPALKQTSSWSSSSTGTRSSTNDLHVSFLIPGQERSDSVSPSLSPRASSEYTSTSSGSSSYSHTGTQRQLHPLFAYTHLDHAPISYDIAFPPSALTIRSRGARKGTRTPPSIPANVLSQPATDPPVYTQLALTSPLFPWEVVVHPNASGTAPYGHRRLRRPVTNYDVLCALHDALTERATSDEWTAVGGAESSSPLGMVMLKQKQKQKQKRVLRAYQDRCIMRGGGWDSGVRRIDWLEGCTRLVGIMLDTIGKHETDTGVRGTLVFKTPT
ncbi:hypothetical protein C8F01DRAFT_375404 [Mycena amicta]|nr:hypothetical protein C8F01DRAFT_375404 [Mycena amicta]